MSQKILKKKLLAIFVLEAEGMLREPVNRQHWVHPFFSQRDSMEKFQRFYENIRLYNEKFFQYYRMSIKSFDELVKILRPHITKENTQFRNSISAEERLTVTLRYVEMS
ncbi:hypothetical protein PV325_009066 [Microctonus aethiopoides]|uniref:Uncharacterized protein n=1 Tax=Microctonus aethiopoides TaxID=144406 RepID=A0AA39KPV1_9HYME|nr:hypothetical protein PV325_009066 [Microctonus aethiopoides]KAK0086422.1 hypothetical protein PV326_005548 [Microctonus aethiopoides]KAK0169493.1 hypothetical protein PV328_011967 [Microctonus aethiopoides]